MIRSVPAWLVGVIASVLVAVPLGLRMGYCLSAPLFGSQSSLAGQGLLLVGLTGLLTVILLGWAAARHAWGPLAAAFALVATATVAAQFAPSAAGSSQSAEGSGSVESQEAGTQLWSGSVVCQWNQGDATIHAVAGFDLVVSDAAMQAELGLDDGALGLGASPRVVAIILPETATGLATLGVGESIDEYTGTGSQPGLALEAINADMSQGRAVSRSGTITFAWSCSRTP
jgi:hypothetical protein